MRKKQENLKNKIKREGKSCKSAHEKIRTSTILRTQPPQACASTNSATCAFIKIKKLSNSLTFLSDRAGARTQDPLLKREMLYQLSYQVMTYLNRVQI